MDPLHAAQHSAAEPREDGPPHVTAADQSLKNSLESYWGKQIVNFLVFSGGAIALGMAGLLGKTAAVTGAVLTSPFTIGAAVTVKALRGFAWAAREGANARLKGDAKFTRDEFLEKYDWARYAYYADEGINNAFKWAVGVICTGDLKPESQRQNRPFKFLPLAKPLPPLFKKRGVPTGTVTPE